MYRLCYCGFLIFLLSGCAAMEQSDSRVAENDAIQTEKYESEKHSLFQQPYIDPLTDYLIEHNGDQTRQAVLQEVRQERDRRCEQIAVQYNNQPATRTVLKRFNLSYAYSCPQQVAAFEERISQRARPSVPVTESKTAAEAPPKTALINQPQIETADTTADQARSDQDPGDCYLLTSIHNYSEARKACREPAENGDVRSQANMAVVAYVFEDYASAFTWAEKAAPESGRAAFLMAEMYATGRGVTQNVDRAVYWYQEAAKQGHRESQAIIDREIEGSPAGDI